MFQSCDPSRNGFCAAFTIIVNVVLEMRKRAANANLAVEVVDASTGAVVATLFTNNDGVVTFSSGLAFGKRYDVVIRAAVLIAAGGVDVSGDLVQSVFVRNVAGLSETVTLSFAGGNPTAIESIAACDAIIVDARDDYERACRRNANDGNPCDIDQEHCYNWQAKCDNKEAAQLDSDRSACRDAIAIDAVLKRSASSFIVACETRCDDVFDEDQLDADDRNPYPTNDGKICDELIKHEQQRYANKCAASKKYACAKDCYDAENLNSQRQVR